MASASRLRPLSLTEILDATFSVYRRDVGRFALIAGLVQVPLAILMALLVAVAGIRAIASPADFEEPSAELIGAVVGGTLLVVVISVLANVLMSAALVRAADDGYLGRAIAVGQSYSDALGRLGAALGTTIVVGVLLVLMTIVVVGIPFAIYFGVCWAFILQVVMIERLGGFGAARRSRALVRGTWWRVLGILVVIGLMVSILSGVASLILGGIVGGLFGLAGSGPDAAIGSIVANQIASAVVASFATPLSLIATTILYYDLRVRKEGFDLQLRTQALGGTVPAEGGL